MAQELYTLTLATPNLKNIGRGVESVFPKEINDKLKDGYIINQVIPITPPQSISVASVLIILDPPGTF